ncbi:MAG: iron ABC transporter permease, partial [Pseudomonadota bacterium]
MVSADVTIEQRARAGHGYRRRAVRKALFVSLIAAALLIVFVVDIMTGPSNLTFMTVLETLFAPSEATPQTRLIVMDLRLPVALMAVIVGAMLGVAGAEMQTILNNPLADPFTLGISSAASFGAALAIVTGVGLFPVVGSYLIPANAFAMALGTAFILYAFSEMRGVSSETMVLVGIALLFSFNALLALLQYGASEIELAQIVFWMLGSLVRANWEKVTICAIVLAVVMPYFMTKCWALTALRMGDDKAASLGVNVRRLRIEVLFGVSLLAAVAVSFVGTIAFVGLVGPHIARMTVGEDQRTFLPVAALASALILSLASIATKTINPGIIYPIGMITSLIGIPFF